MEVRPIQLSEILWRLYYRSYMLREALSAGMDATEIETLLNEEEGTSLDFKRDPYAFVGATDDEKGELLKDILTFANSWRRTEAFILIGVNEVRGARSQPVGVAEHHERLWSPAEVGGVHPSWQLNC